MWHPVVPFAKLKRLWRCCISTHAAFIILKAIPPPLGSVLSFSPLLLLSKSKTKCKRLEKKIKTTGDYNRRSRHRQRQRLRLRLIRLLLAYDNLLCIGPKKREYRNKTLEIYRTFTITNTTKTTTKTTTTTFFLFSFSFSFFFFFFFFSSSSSSRFSTYYRILFVCLLHHFIINLDVETFNL